MIDIPDSRVNFESTWLAESPNGIPKTDLSASIITAIRDRLNYGFRAIELGSGYKKIEGDQVVFYWYEDTGKILLGVELEKRYQALVVNGVGKANRGVPPYASDLYDVVLRDRKNMPGMNSVRIMSDRDLSEEGLAIWQRLLEKGHKVSIYDAANPGQSFVEITSVEDMQQYFKMGDKEFRRWQYIISESGVVYAETRGFFLTRKMRELHEML